MLCGGERFLDAEFLHPGSKGVGMETQPRRGALFPFNDPIRILKDAEDVGSFDFFQRIGDWQQWGGVPLKHHLVDLKQWLIREDGGPFDHIF